MRSSECSMNSNLIDVNLCLQIIYCLLLLELCRLCLSSNSENKVFPIQDNLSVILAEILSQLHK
jgi:hypothetical protein